MSTVDRECAICILLLAYLCTKKQELRSVIFFVQKEGVKFRKPHLTISRLAFITYDNHD